MKSDSKSEKSSRNNKTTIKWDSDKDKLMLDDSSNGNSSNYQ